MAKKKIAEVGVKLSDKDKVKPIVPMTKPELLNKATQGMIEHIDARITLLQTQIDNLTRQRDALKVKIEQNK